MTILLVEQKYELALAHSERCVVHRPRRAWSTQGLSAALLADQSSDRPLSLGLAH